VIYPAICDGVRMHLFGTQCILLRGTDDKRMGYTEVETSFYRHVDGRTSFDRLVDIVAEQHEIREEDRSLLHDRLTQFTEVELGAGLLQFKEQPTFCRPFTTGVLGSFFPHMVNLEITGVCNQRCLHCYRECGTGIQVHMSYDHVRELLSKWTDLIPWLHITGGEPTCHPEFCRIVQVAKEHFHKVSIVSNGAGIDKLSVNVLEGVDFVQISLFGTSPKEHDAVTMCNGSFDRACRAVGLLSEAGIPHVVSVVLDRERAQHVEQFIAFACTLGAEAISFGQLSPVGRGKDLDWVLDRDVEQRVTEKLFALKDRYSDRIRVGTWVDKDEFIGPLLPGGRLGCGAGELSVAVSEQGDVRPCEMLPRGVFLMGNVFQESIDRIIERNLTGPFDEWLAILDISLHRSGKAARNVCEPIGIYLNSQEQ